MILSFTSSEKQIGSLIIYYPIFQGPVIPRPAPLSLYGNQPATKHLSTSCLRLPAYNDEDTFQSPGNIDNLHLNFDPNAVNILDMPAPAALHHN